MLLNNQEMTEEIKEEIKKYLQIKDHILQTFLLLPIIIYKPAYSQAANMIPHCSAKVKQVTGAVANCTAGTFGAVVLTSPNQRML